MDQDQGAQSADSPATIINIEAIGGANGSSYVALMNGLQLGKKMLSVQGELLIGGVATAGTVRVVAPGSYARGTVLHVLNGGNMTVGNQTNEIAVASSIVVAPGGSLTFAAGTSAAFRYKTVANEHVVDGLLEIQAPFSGSADIGFIGTGVVNTASIVDPESGSSTVRLAGGITLKNAAWNAENIKLAVPVGESAVVTNTGSAAFELAKVSEVGTDATLTLQTDALKFSEVGKSVDGIVRIAANSLVITDDIAATAKSGYVNLLTAQDIVGELTAPEGYAFQLEDNGTSKTLKIRQRVGMMFYFR